MKVLMIAAPPLSRVQVHKEIVPPVALLHLAAILREHAHEIYILDLSVLGVSCADQLEAHVVGIIKDYRPGLIGISCPTTLHFRAISALAQKIRAAFPAIKIALGGAHPSLFPVEILSHCAFFDYVVEGEGEEVLLDVVEALESCETGGEPDFNNIQAMAYRRNGQVIAQPRQSFVTDLDELPDPAWDLIDFRDYYTDHSSWHNPKQLCFSLNVPILTSRSCVFKCNFCAAYKTMGRKVRKRSPQRVVDEIEMLYDRGENYFSFIDDNINLDKKHIIGICEEICRRRIEIQFDALSGLHVGLLDEEVIDAMDAAGCVFARLAIEHGNDELRNQIIGKRLKRAVIYDVCQLLKKKPKIKTAGMFIMGFPEDTCETLEDTRKMIIELELDLNYVFNLLPLPGTAVFDQAKRDNLLIVDFRADKLWEGNISLDIMQGGFYIQPYNMTITDLERYRCIFDDLKAIPRRDSPDYPDFMNRVTKNV